MTAPDSPPPSHDQVVAEVQARLARIQDRDAARELVSAEVSRRPADECVDAAMAVLWPLVVRAREAAEAAEVVPADRDALALVVAELMSTADTRPEAVEAAVDRVVGLFAPVLAEAAGMRADLSIRYHALADALGVPRDDDQVRGYYTAVDLVAALRADVVRLGEEVQGYQVGDRYAIGHEHGVQAAVQALRIYARERDELRAEVEELRRIREHLVRSLALAAAPLGVTETDVREAPHTHARQIAAALASRGDQP